MKTGDTVKFLGASQEQIKWGGNDDPNKILKIGDEYEIRSIEVHSWHTKVSLMGYSGKFNSSSFEVVNKEI